MVVGLCIRVLPGNVMQGMLAFKVGPHRPPGDTRAHLLLEPEHDPSQRAAPAHHPQLWI